MLADIPANRAVVLTYACGEDDRIYAAHLGNVRTDDLLNRQVEHILSQRCTRVAVSNSSIPVSYTHLDVYKRQASPCFISL